MKAYRRVSETGGYYPRLEEVMEKNLQALKHQEKLAVWSERIADCRSSGIGVKAWCEGNGVSSSSYYKWQKKLFSLAVQNAPQFAMVAEARMSTSLYR